MTLRVIRPGLLTTVQDRGRHGLQHIGVVPSGAMDTVALALANSLVGNPSYNAALEITLLGPELEFENEALVALCGAEMESRVGSATSAERLPENRPVLIEKGTVLKLTRTTLGSRAYLAVAGGIALPEVLGSRSTYLPAKFGGFQGRALRAGDRLPLIDNVTQVSLKRYQALQGKKDRAGLRTVAWSVPSLTLPMRDPLLIHAMEGRHHALFDAAARRAFFEATWKMTPDSNRMGFRLTGPVLAREEAGEILSEPACLGTVQVPANGMPIALMADHQTTGGYPKIAEIAAADVPRLAQLAPGGTVQFGRCSLAQARELRSVLRERIQGAVRALAWNFRTGA
jgi:antagonist of KipI